MKTTREIQQLVGAVAVIASLFISNSLHAQNSASDASAGNAPNYILMIGDDMAVETLDCYGVGSDTAHTPNLDNLCQDGMRFDNFWSQPVCSPTRATLLTGQYGFTNGVGTPGNEISGIDWQIPDTGADEAPAAMAMAMAAQTNVDTTIEVEAPARPGLAADAYTFLHALKADNELGYQTAVVGKWHLADDLNGGLAHPLEVGFDHYSGSLRGGGVASFEGWSKVIDGSAPFGKTGYATSDVVDDGIAWLEQLDEDNPWFLWVAFNAPHSPFHMPPRELLSSDAKDLDSGSAAPRELYKAMIEAMDTEIGRLLSSLDEETRANTYVIFMGDNGTPNQTVSAPFTPSKAKGSVYQGGVNVPFMVAGPGIESGQVTQSLANSVDVYSTVLELADTSLSEDAPGQAALHSVSLTSVLENAEYAVREFAYADVFGPVRNGTANSRAIRNDRYKLIEHFIDDVEEFYDLMDDPYENNNLLLSELSGEEQTNYEELKQQILGLTGTEF